MLSALATLWAKTLVEDIEILFDDVWVVRHGDHFFAEPERFAIYGDRLRRYPGLHEHLTTHHRDWWCFTYQPKPGDVILDVGAGRGDELFLFCPAIGPTGRVVAIEAHPQIFRLLRTMCRLNGFGNTRVLQLAVGEAPGEVVITDAEDILEATTVNADARPGFRVPCQTLDYVVRAEGIEAIDLLKMNIEGAEVRALGGAAETLERTRHIVVACHDHRAARGDGSAFRTQEAVLDVLSSRGFDVSRRSTDARDYVRDFVYGRNRAHRAP